MTKKILAALLALVFLILLAGAGWLLFFGGLDALLPPPAPLPPPAALQSPVQGLYIPAASLPSQGQDAFLSQAVDFAAANGFNTLYFEARTGQQALWKDGSFPHGEYDAVKTLSSLCAEKGLALFLKMDPYAAGNAPEKGALSGRYEITDGAFSPADQAYRKLFTDSLRRAAAAYPLNGVLLTQDPEGLLSAALNEAGLSVGLWTRENDAAVCTPKSQETPQEFAARVPQAAVWDLLEADSSFEAGLSEKVMQGSFAGAVTARYPDDINALHARTLTASLTSAVPLKTPGFPIPSTLSVGYPAAGERIYTANCFVMGSSDPSLPLLLDGKEVVRYGTGGVFGVLVPLAMGENHFVFSQGETTLEYTVYRAQGASAKDPVRDATGLLEAGAAVEVDSWLCSVLSDPNDDGSIVNTLPLGARMTVAASHEVRRGSQITTAYELTSGGYVLAWYVKEIAPAEAALSGPFATKDEKGELLTFNGGQPAALAARSESSLTLLFPEAKANGIVLPESAFLQNLEARETAGGLELTLTLKDPDALWGYRLSYENGQTLLYLKRAPALSSRFASPLEGVTVMVDAGHGGTDTGALTPAGTNNEKDVNLALAQAIGARLEQLGAAVIQTRSGDDKVSLEERSRLFVQEKPDFFIAVHHNSILLNNDANTAKGVECYYFDEGLSKPFAEKLTGLVSAATGRKARGVFWDYFYVTRSTLAPSVLFEYGFLPCPAEFEDCFSDEGITAAAFATAQGIVEMVPAGR